MPLSRWGHAAAATGGKVYVIAGETDDDHKKTILELDPVERRWCERAASRLGGTISSPPPTKAWSMRSVAASSRGT